MLLYAFGLLCMAFGVAFAVNSNLGVSPVNSLPYAVSQASGLTLGNCVIIVFSIYVLVQIVLLRRDFKLKNLLQLVFSTMFGYFADFAKWVVGDFAIPTYFGQLAMICISILLVSFGLVFYLSTDIVPMPMEGMTLAITEKLGKYPMSRVKMVVDTTSVVLALIVLLVFTGSYAGVREGTILAALVTGRVMGLMMKPLKPRVEALCFDGR